MIRKAGQGNDGEDSERYRDDSCEYSEDTGSGKADEKKNNNSIVRSIVCGDAYHGLRQRGENFIYR